jgi:hypothetical protein
MLPGRTRDIPRGGNKIFGSVLDRGYDPKLGAGKAIKFRWHNRCSLAAQLWRRGRNCHEQGKR